MICCKAMRILTFKQMCRFTANKAMLKWYPLGVRLRTHSSQIPDPRSILHLVENYVIWRDFETYREKHLN